MVGMSMKWFQTAPQHIEKLEVIFPVVGHSYLPPDRVFGNIEKVDRIINTLVSPDEYYEIFGTFGSVSNTFQFLIGGCLLVNSLKNLEIGTLALTALF